MSHGLIIVPCSERRLPLYLSVDREYPQPAHEKNITTIGRSVINCERNRVSLDWQVIQDIDERLEKRLGRLHARLRLGIEADHEAQLLCQLTRAFPVSPLTRHNSRRRRK
jgi:hypothetical protein